MVYILRQGVLPDQSSKTFSQKDILIRDGIVVQIADHIACPEDAVEISLGGKYISPGWIDAHAHLYTGEGAIGVEKDSFLETGVTYVMEAGTTGAGNYEDYRSECVLGRRIQGRAYLNLAFMGINFRYGELKDLKDVDLDAIRRICKRYRDEIAGIKVRIDSRVCENAGRALKMAAGAGRELDLPVVVHASRCDISMEAVLSYLKEGDIFAHCYADKAPGLLDMQGVVKKAAWEAKERGVRFDVSHGNGNFSFQVAKAALKQGFLPDAVSSDIHVGSIKNVVELSNVMSKMMLCGLDFWKVLSLVTVDAAAMLRETQKTTDIRPGMPADFTVFSVEHGDFVFRDSDGYEEHASKRFVSHGSILGNGCYLRDFSLRREISSCSALER